MLASVILALVAQREKLLEIVEGEPGAPWTEVEIAETVATYFQMLRTQELGQSLNKAEHNRRLQQRLPARTRGAIEFKHANISAVLMEIYDAPPLRGYLPRSNYQSDLVVAVGRALSDDRVLDEAALRNVEQPAVPALLNNFDGLLVDAPQRARGKVREVRKDWSAVAPLKRDYLQREARNRSLGLAGELLVMEYEAKRLHSLGALSLADKVNTSRKCVVTAQATTSYRSNPMAVSVL